MIAQLHPDAAGEFSAGEKSPCMFNVCMYVCMYMSSKHVYVFIP